VVKLLQPILSVTGLQYDSATLKFLLLLHGERTSAVTSAFATLTPKGETCLATTLLFQGPSLPMPPVKAGGGPSQHPVEAGKPAVQKKQYARRDPLAQGFPPPLPESPPPCRGEGFAEAPLPAGWPGAATAPSDRPTSPNPVPWYPPLPPPTLPSPRTPVTRCTDKKVTDTLLPEPPVPNPYNPFSLPPPPCAMPWNGGLGTREGLGVRWRGIAKVGCEL